MDGGTISPLSRFHVPKTSYSPKTLISGKTCKFVNITSFKCAAVLPSQKIPVIYNEDGIVTWMLIRGINNPKIIEHV